MFMYVDLNTWAVETGQQAAVGGQSLAGQSGEWRCCRGELGQLGGKMTRKRRTSLTKEEKTLTHIKLSLNFFSPQK